MCYHSKLINKVIINVNTSTSCAKFGNNGTEAKHCNVTTVDTMLGSGIVRPATPVFCEVKLLFLSKESGGFKKSDITALTVPLWKGLSDGKVRR